MAYDLDILKTFRCANAVTIRVPARWKCEPHEIHEGMWGCYEDDEETGTLWINVDYFLLPDGEPPDPEFDFRQSIADLIFKTDRDRP